MQRKPSRLPSLPRLILAFALGFLVLWVFLVPLTEGYHIGFNAATDHTCFSRIIQWCK